MTSLIYGSATRGSAARSQRTLLFAMIAGLHAAAIALLVSGFGKVLLQMPITEIIGTVIEKPKQTPVDTPQPQGPTLTQPFVDPGPRPDVDIDIDGDNGGAITAPFVEQPQPPVTVAPPAPLPIHLVGKHRLPNTDDYYPAKDIRDEVEGVSTVGVCIDANGRRNSEPTVVQSSGSASLDAGAMRVLRDGRYARAMQGDQYVSNCYQFRIVFKLKKP
jgi:TonB family protein